ncbi:MAG: Hsp33 family molecular chaperone HslO [Lentisphaeria bacterium]|nr:Hsp33 family molecular chaperone HslO [Lentisphaeria bacterium]
MNEQGKKSDCLIRGTVSPLNIRFIYVDVTKCANSIARVHHCDPAAADLIAQGVVAGALTIALLDGDERYSIRWNYHGALKNMICDVQANGKLRCVMNSYQMLDAIQKYSDLLGEDDGGISLVKSTTGKVLNSGETKAGLLSIVDDLSLFFSISDQIESEAIFSVKISDSPGEAIHFAQGMLIQALPGCDLEKFAQIRDSLHQAPLEILRDEVVGLETKIKLIVNELTGIDSVGTPDTVKYEFGVTPEFACDCSYEKMREALSTLGEAELKKLFQENPHPKIRCNFCEKEYVFKSEDFFS